MRAFIAIALPEQCRTTIDHLQQYLKPCEADVRWIKTGAMHLTLKFLGEIDPKVIPVLAESLEDVTASESRIELRLHRLGCFPNMKQPRIVWCGLDGEMEKLSRLQSLAESACSRIGFSPEQRGFHPHLTLGRVTGKRNLRQLLDCITIAPEMECGFTVNAFSIYKSVLQPSGAEYSIVRTFMLR
jgi:RNA 2',3'-cyclic 3'-phosphodiesterase